MPLTTALVAATISTMTPLPAEPIAVRFDLSSDLEQPTDDGARYMLRAIEDVGPERDRPIVRLRWNKVKLRVPLAI